MKKIIAILAVLAMVIGCVACTQAPAAEAPTQEAAAPAAATVDEIPDTMTSSDGKYLLAFVTDVGDLKDMSFNQGCWEGIKDYAAANGKSYKYYQPANGNEATDDDRYDAMKAAVDGGAEVIVCAGFMQGTALTKAATEFADTKFVFIDGWVLADEAGKTLANVAPITFREEQCGYFAGYAVVMDGHTKLGFCGGGGNTNPACCRYGYGWVQGAQAAAEKLGVKVEMNYSWEYGAAYSASPELQTMANGWYENGTQVIFPCGGKMFLSVAAAASANDGWCLGVDSDQAGDSDTVLTSALKGVGAACKVAIGKFYEGKWDEMGGVETKLGVNEDAVGIPTAEGSWRFSKFTVAEYEDILKQVKDGTLVVDDQYPEDMSTGSFANVTVKII